MKRFYNCLFFDMFEPILGHVATPHRGQGIPTGSERTSAAFASGYSTGPGRAARPSARAVVARLNRAGGGPHGSFNPASRATNRPPVPARRIAKRALRKTGTGCGAPPGRIGKAAHHRHGLQSAAPRLCPLDGAVGRRAGRQAKIGAPGRPGDGAGLVAQPRPEAVAGEKCGA